MKLHYHYLSLLNSYSLYFENESKKYFICSGVEEEGETVAG
jgi:hypothetical protein